MNKTVVMIAVVLGILTAFIVTDTVYSPDEPDGETSYGVNIGGIIYWAVPDISIRTYNDNTLMSPNVYIEEGKIGKNAFRNCTKLERVYCSVFVNGIGDSAFEGCTNLESVYMPRVKYVGESAFMGSSVSEVTVGPLLERIGDYAFANCKNLKGPILADTAVKTLGIGVFYDSDILAEDIRGITSMDETAFKDARVRFMAMRSDQVLFNDYPTRVYDDEKLFTEFRYHSDGDSEGVKIRVGQYCVADPYDRDNEPIAATYSCETLGNSTVTYSTIMLEDGQDCYIRIGSTTVCFQEGLGLDDAVVHTGSGYTLPDGPRLGDLTFLGWTVPGIDGYVSVLTAGNVADMWPTVEPSAHYSVLNVTFDHSQLDASLSAALPQGMEFTFGSEYPSLNDAGDMRFACWSVDGVVFESGEPITEYTEHTARSVWAEDGIFRLTVHGCSAEVYSVIDTVCTSAVILNDIEFEEPDNRILIGWSLSDGGDRIRTETIRLVSDTDIYPVTKNRTEYTVTYKDGNSTIGTQKFYEDRVSAISVELPEKAGKRFLRWVCGGIQYHMGDMLETDRDLVMYSEWVTLPEFEVVYAVEPAVRYSFYEGTEISVGVETQPPEHKLLTGWTDGSGGNYADGDSFTVDRDVSFSPVWADCPKYIVNIRCFNGDTIRTEVYSDEDLVLTEPEPYAGFSFEGWGVYENGPSEYRAGNIGKISGDLVLFEIWNENGHFRVTVHDGISEPLTARIGETLTVELRPMEKEGFCHLGWSIDAASITPEYEPSSTIILADATDLYPVWERLLTLTYNDGEDVRSEYHRSGSTAELAIPVREGFEFSGWSYEPDGTPVANSSIVMTEDVLLYAIWGSAEDDEPYVSEEPQTKNGIGIAEVVSATTVVLVTCMVVRALRRN